VAQRERTRDERQRDELDGDLRKHGLSPSTEEDWAQLTAEGLAGHVSGALHDADAIDWVRHKRAGRPPSRRNPTWLPHDGEPMRGRPCSRH
jgi:hypothetical protein